MRDYVKQAVRTESPAFHRIGAWPFETVLAQFVCAATDLDHVKKQVFYNKFPSMFQDGNALEVDRRTQRLIHGILGIATEAGELVEALHKHLFQGEALDEVNLFEELGDVEWYEAILCDEFGFDEDHIKERNIAKLRKRFPDKFSEELAVNRDVEGERNELAASS